MADTKAPPVKPVRVPDARSARAVLVRRARELALVPALLLLLVLGALLNDSFVLDKATALADRLNRECTDDAARIRRLYALLLSRNPTNAELEIATDAVKQDGLTKFCQILLCTNEFTYVD